MQKTTAKTLQEMKDRGEKITMVTCYDSTFAKMLNLSEVDSILVGDSLGNNVLGFDTTLPVTVDNIIHHTKAVMRTSPQAFVVADMPFMSYQVSKKDAVKNAGRLVKEGGAHAVKLEGGADFVDEIKAITRAQIPVVAHLGLTPQSVNVFGGYKVQAKTEKAVEKLISDAGAVEFAGAVAIVLEGIPREVAKRVTEEVSIPTIGIGAGPDVDGQVLVLQDLLGLNQDVPKFVKKFADLRTTTIDAFNQYVQEVKSGKFPDDAHSFHFNTNSSVASEQSVDELSGKLY